MRLSYIKIVRADTCGGLLDGLELAFDRPETGRNESIAPLCLVGPNGSGKSQFLQTLAEIFQDAWHAHAPQQERSESNPQLLFELTYEIQPVGSPGVVRVRLSRRGESRLRSGVHMELFVEGNWVAVAPDDEDFGKNLPPIIVGYTSGDNETLSLPFFKSRSGYAKDVREAALDPARRAAAVPNNRLLLIDYGTHLEVLIANLMLGNEQLRSAILGHASLDRLASWRCVIQLAHSAVGRTKPVNGRRGVKLTDELEQTIAALRRCSTSQHHDEATDTYTLDFFVDAESRKAFRANWDTAAGLYRAFHKLAMLNDLAIPKKARSRLNKEMQRGHFAARLPEPQDESKVFRFEEVRFHREGHSLASAPVDYVSLSDGEHQQAQIFGVFSMIVEPGALFLLDEPESHFNPQWRVKFISRLMQLPVDEGTKREVILTSHAPFVPSDMHREQVVIFKKGAEKIHASSPEIETFGASFDRILQHCFNVEPPISQLARDEISRLKQTGSAEEIEEALSRLGSSVEKAFLVDRLRQLKTDKG